MTAVWVWGPAVAQMIAIFILSSIPGIKALPGGITDYAGHFIGYALLAVLVLRSFARARWAGVNASAAARAVGFASLYGVTDEVHQMFVPNRTATIEDWIADVCGAVAGVLLVLLAARLQSRRAIRDV